MQHSKEESIFAKRAKTSKMGKYYIFPQPIKFKVYDFYTKWDPEEKELPGYQVK